MVFGPSTPPFTQLTTYPTPGCPEWHPWSPLSPLNYALYILLSGLFAYVAARLVKAFAPYAAGSGISEIKCIIAGFVMTNFLGPWTLAIKSIGLPLAIASGLSVGKEGPSVHYAVCTGSVISRFFERYRRNASRTREILTACAAAGVAVAFGSPIGGVLFSLEVRLSLIPQVTSSPSDADYRRKWQTIFHSRRCGEATSARSLRPRCSPP